METHIENAAQQAEEIEVLQSIYGSEWKKEIDGSYAIEINNEVKLFLNFNTSYPLEAPPTYQLLAPSLSKTKKLTIETAFNDIYMENIGCTIVYQWIEKLREIVQQEDVQIDDNSEENPTEKEEINEEDIKCNYDIQHGPIVEDRKSIFQGHVCTVHSEKDMRNVLNILMENKKIASATHNILAYKIKLPNGTIQDCNDDGENHAGGRLLHLLQILNIENVMVIVTRWYGGVHLGPDRFRHINNAARLALKSGGYIK